MEKKINVFTTNYLLSLVQSYTMNLNYILNQQRKHFKNMLLLIFLFYMLLNLI